MIQPESPAAIAGATWADLEPYYDELERQPLDAASVEQWLREWSRLEEILTEAISTAMIAYTCNTADPDRAAAHRRFAVEISPKAEERSVRLARRLVALEYSRPELEQMLARFRRSIEIFREESVPLLAELEELSTQYQRVTGSFLAEWEGKSMPLPQLAPFLQSPDRSVRERAFRATVAPYLAAREELSRQFDQMFELRETLARQAGFHDFQAYSFAAKFRFDYSPEDCARFHAAVEQVVMPAVERLHALRRTRLGLERLRPWDLAATLYRDQPLRPFDTAAELSQGTYRIFRRVDPGLGEQFRTLMDENLLDLESRKDKAPGGYCDTLHFRGRPFIFMNSSGVFEDVMVLLHESGHGFHSFASHAQPLIWQRHPSSEAAELASMSMELLATPWLGPPEGLLDERDAVVARIEHLEDVLITLPHVASVDAFQTWLYTSGSGGDGQARDAAWLRVRDRFERGVDWEGLERERVARWYRQLHVFLYPFYYIEYGLAQLGALLVWRNSRRNAPEAVAAYRRFLARGATASLPELYREAGAALVFDAENMRVLVQEVEQELARLRRLLD